MDTAERVACLKELDMKTAQLLGLMRYEMLMQWRRGALRVILVMFILAPLLAALLVLASMQQMDMSATQWSEFYNPEFRFTAMAIFIVLPLAPLIFIALPVLVADSIPIDRQLGTRDLFDVLPLERRVYLLGKVLGVWGGLLLTFGLAIVVLGIAFRLMHGPFSLGVWVLLWVVGIAPMALITSGISMLFSAGYPRRRPAVMTAFALIPIFVHLFASSSMMQFLMASVDPETALLQDGNGVIVGVEGITIEFVTLLGVGCIAALLGVGLWAWNWLRVQDAKL